VSTAQKQATRAHRQRAQRRGLVRVEVTVDVADRALVREVAGRLRDDAEQAHHLRDALRRLLTGHEERNLLDELACELPDEVVDEALARPRDLGRAVEL
jgi:hypothetical protein